MGILINGVPPEVWLWIAFGLFAIIGLSLFFVDLFTSRLSPAEQWWSQMDKALAHAKEVQQRSCVSSETHKACRIIDEGDAIEFMPCGIISYHPTDIQYRYCAACNQIISREL